jgi:hypothetical protein
MTIQNYLIIENNVVTNDVVWDGNAQSWTPPSDATMLVQSTTPAIVWVWNNEQNDFVLSEIVGEGGIGFTWNGTILTTNEPKPEVPTPPSQESA